MSEQLGAPDPARVYFLDEVCAFLRVSRRTVEKLRRHGAFPLTELSALDKRPRWSGAEILRFLEGQSQLTGARRGRHGRQFVAVKGGR